VKGPGRDDVLVEKKRDDILRKKAYLMSYRTMHPRIVPLSVDRCEALQ
jgi:hypothetical protein